MTAANSKATEVIVALDQGTSSSRAVAFALDGTVLAIEQEPLSVHYPHDAWVEQDPDEIWHTQQKVLHAVLEAVPLGSVRALGITNQRETTLVWDRLSGKALAPAIVWQCRRTAALCQQLREAGKEELVRERTGLVLDPYFSASKVRWLIDFYPEVAKAVTAGTAVFGTVDTWLLYHLSGKRALLTEPSNASRTMLMSLHTGDWDAELLDLWQVQSRSFATIVNSAGTFCTTQYRGCTIPITGVLGDQQAALLGHGCIRQGMSKCTFGTGAFLLAHTGETPPHSESGMLATVAWRLPSGQQEYALEGSIFVAGAAVQWLRDNLKLISSAGESEQLAASVANSGGVVFVPSFTGLGAPHWKPEVRGAIHGLTRDTTAGHIVRAALEGVAHQLCDLLEDAQFEHCQVLRVDGGMSANTVFCQILADLTGRDIEVPSFSERTALGAARMAALGAGIFDSLPAAIGGLHVPSDRINRFEPSIALPERASRRQQWKYVLERL